MKITILQFQSCPNPSVDPYQDLESRVRKLASSSAGIGDVLVLPELWNMPLSTGSPRRYADENGQKTKGLLSSLAKEFSTNIVGGSIIEKRGRDYFNCSHIFDREGKHISSYDKAHLYSTVIEKKLMSPGNKLCIFTLDGIKCGLIICYDIDFPEWTRMLALKGIQLLFIPSAWPKPYIHHLEILLKSRALENQIFIICSNQFNPSKSQGPEVTGGHSQIVDPQARVKLMLEDDDSHGTCFICPEETEKIKEYYDFYLDRRPELYSF